MDGPRWGFINLLDSLTFQIRIKIGGYRNILGGVRGEFTLSAECREGSRNVCFMVTWVGSGSILGWLRTKG